MIVVTVVTVVSKINFFSPKKLFSRENFFFTKKPLHKIDHATSSHKKSRNLSTEKIISVVKCVKLLFSKVLGK